MDGTLCSGVPWNTMSTTYRYKVRRHGGKRNIGGLGTVTRGSNNPILSTVCVVSMRYVLSASGSRLESRRALPITTLRSQRAC